MSNKNKIAIIFEMLGIDKALSSLSDFSKKLLNTEKSTKQTVKATEELDEETKKLSSSIQKAGVDINKTAVSTKNLNDANRQSKKTNSDLYNSIKNQAESYRDLAKQLEEQKRARNGLVEEVLNKENKSTEDLISINNEYIKTLEDMKQASSVNISTSKEEIEYKKKLSKELDNAKKAQSELNQSIEKGALISIIDK